METTVQQWGNSLALRIPRAYASHARLKRGTKVELAARDGRLVVTAAGATTPRLDTLLAGITAKNLHRAIDTGARVGREVW